MSYSEIGVMLLIYSGLLLYFLIPSLNELSCTNQQQSSKRFTQVLKESLKKLSVHKKAIFALILLIFTLLFIWFNTKAADDHFNAHSGYPPISSNFQAIYSMCGVMIYTIALYLLLAFVNTFKVLKNGH